MHTRICQKGKFEEKDLKSIQEAIRAAGLDPAAVIIESDWHFVNINKVVEIQPVLFDCRGLLDTASWIVRRRDSSVADEPCSCGVMTRGGEIGTYNDLQEAIATAVAEVVRLKVLAKLHYTQEGASDKTSVTDNPIHYPNDFIRHSLHR